MGKLDPDDSRPPYRQIADALRADIEAGKLAPGAQLPALPALSSEYEVSTGTVKSALAVLRDAGLIVTRQGKGSYVRTRQEPVDDKPTVTELDELRRLVEGLVERVEQLERRLADR
ncbi:regulatory protein, gntR family [Amycolatopsis sacchari]|uniref:Regulatory protein, gntR family n=1 Tax=Amycolatopsis sacchari TaxID=115433 RepID=A0A1I3V742_9PSEU|nr:GntR family transcriptional regulator [Amycolatopsis sacchari]SFJ91105.1 regulatory protein, gntR family [Amycolatopsis sacchari]